MHKILVTGASGVLAKNLIKKFSEENGFKIIASSRNIENLNKIDGVHYVNNNELIDSKILTNIDTIINCAFPRKYEPNILAEALAFYASLIDKAVDLKVKSIINISSQDIYGNYREIPADELTQINPQNNYALTKFSTEVIGSSIVKNSNTKLTNIRLGSLIGEGYPERVINKIISNAINTKIISINNDKNIFGYMDVEDSVNGIIAFVKNSKPEKWTGIYNFGQKYAEQKSFKFIVQTIADCFRDQKINIELDITETEMAEKLCLLNSSSFYKVANWKPQISLKTSIERIFEKILNEN